MFNKEYDLVTQNAGTLMNAIYNNFEGVLDKVDISAILDDSNSQMTQIKQPIQNVRDLVADKITTYLQRIL